MPNLTNLEFNALDISGENYLSWVLDAELYLVSEGLGDTIKEGNTTSSRDKAKAIIFLRHHIHDDLKSEYLTVKEPEVLWTSLKDRYDHQRTVVLPKARYDWIHLRIQDFKSVSEYNSAMFKITSKLKLCGEDVTDKEMLEKTFSTFHASNVILQTQYREKGFKKYSELISSLLVAEQNNELLMKNHEIRPTGSTPIPEVNAVSGNYQRDEHNRGYGRNRGRGRRYGFGRGRGRSVSFKNSNYQQRWEKKDENKQKETLSQDVTNECFRCGAQDHWSRTCRTPKHLVDLYQESLKQ